MVKRDSLSVSQQQAWILYCKGRASSIQSVNVASILKITEEVIKQGMVDRIIQLIRLEIFLGDVGRMLCFIYQDMVPGLILGWPALGHLLIPVFFALEGSIHIHDDPAIIKEPVVNQLTDVEFTNNLAHAANRPWKKRLVVGTAFR